MASCAHEVPPVGPPTKASSDAAPLIVDADAPTPTLRKSTEAFTVSAHPVPLRAWLSRLFKLAPASTWAKAESQLDLPTGLLTSPTLLDDLGIDANGVLTLETFELDARATAQVKRIENVDRSLADDVLGETLAGEPHQRDGWFLTRLRVPVRAGAKLGKIVESSLGHLRASRWQSPSSDVRVFGLHDTLWVLRDVPGSLEIGLAMGPSDLRGSDARVALAALSAWGSAPPLELRESDIVAELHPSAIADAGLWIDLMRVLDVTSSGDVDVEVARRILAQGFREATETLRISAPDGAARYDDLRVTVRGLDITVKSSLASSAPRLDAATWSTDGAGLADLAFPTTGSNVATNGALAYAWPLLPRTPGQNPFHGGTARRAVVDAGFAGAVLVLGDLPFLATRLALEGAEPLGQATLPFMRRFERLAVSHPSPTGESIYFGLLVNDATEEQAACALAREPEKCAKTERIGAKGTTSLKGFFVTRRRVDGRWVVAASPDKALLDKTPLAVKAGARPALRATVDLDANLGKATGAGLGRWAVVVERSADAASFELTCRPAP